MIITKKTNGAIVLTHSNGDTETLSKYATLKEISNNEILVRQTQGESVSIFLTGLQVQVEPAVPTNWTGSSSALILYLADNFFFELSGGGSGDLASVLLAGNNAGSSNINMNSKNIDNVKVVDFDSTSTVDPLTGGVAWNDKFGTLQIGLKGGTIRNKIGQQEYARVVNKTVPNIDLLPANYEVCVVSGATGQRLSVKLAKGDSDVNSAGTLGIVAEKINKNQEGFLITFGTLEDINTTGSLQGETWTDGDILYLSPFTFGAITNIKPVAPNHLVVVGYVEYAHPLFGKIFVKIDNGYELSELHDVAYPTAPANGEVLLYDLTQSRWENTMLNLASTIYSNNYINEASTQWSKTLTAPVSLPNGQTANGFTFFSDLTDRVASGCTSYSEYFLAFTRKLTLTGTSGTANVNVNGVNYLATFNTSLTQTATNFVATHGAAILANSGVKVAAVAGVLRFGYSSSALLSAITITNVTTNLNGTFDTAIGDHVVVPYLNQPYNGLRLTHQFRVNFNIVTGTVQTAALSLRRWLDDSVIGSEIQVDRNPDVSGVQENFISYTAGANDPFVTGGFYFALRNDSGVSLDISGTVGVLIITTFQKPVNF